MITGEGDDVQVIITELSWLTHLSIKSNKVDHPINSDMELDVTLVLTILFAEREGL